MSTRISLIGAFVAAALAGPALADGITNPGGSSGSFPPSGCVTPNGVVFNNATPCNSGFLYDGTNVSVTGRINTGAGAPAQSIPTTIDSTGGTLASSVFALQSPASLPARYMWTASNTRGPVDIFMRQGGTFAAPVSANGGSTYAQEAWGYVGQMIGDYNGWAPFSYVEAGQLNSQPIITADIVGQYQIAVADGNATHITNLQFPGMSIYSTSVAFTNGLTGQFYNTGFATTNPVPSVSAAEYIGLSWTANVASVGPVAVGTGTLRQMSLTGAQVNVVGPGSNGTSLQVNQRGTVSAPAICITSSDCAAGTGMYSAAANYISFAVQGVQHWDISPGGALENNGANFSASTALGGLRFVAAASGVTAPKLLDTANGVLALVASTTTNPVEFDVYNTASSANAVNELMAIGFVKHANIASIDVLTTGATQRSFGIYIGGTSALTISTAQLVAIAQITSDATHTDATICEDTTTHGLYFGSGTLGICLGTSGRQFKTGLVPMAAGLAEVKQIELFNYRYLPGWGDGGARLQFGPTAQSIESVPSLAVLVGHDGSGEAINYDMGALIPIGLRAIQELDDKKADRSEVAMLRADNDNLRTEVETLKRLVGGQ